MSELQRIRRRRLTLQRETARLAIYEALADLAFDIRQVERLRSDERIAHIRDCSREERARVEALIARDRSDRLTDAMRDMAEIEIGEGRFLNIADAVVGPTPEWLTKGDTVPFTPPLPRECPERGCQAATDEPPGSVPASLSPAARSGDRLRRLPGLLLAGRSERSQRHDRGLCHDRLPEGGFRFSTGSRTVHRRAGRGAGHDAAGARDDRRRTRLRWPIPDVSGACGDPRCAAAPGDPAGRSRRSPAGSKFSSM